MIHERYMRRALELARKGYPYAMPNPMVGAVITGPDGRIIGEGYHRKCGGPHAEVNAIASVTYQRDLSKATIYVTLEPCAHYGRTGPCAKLIIDTHIPHVVVGCRDPFAQVDGKGIEMLRHAGVEVTLGVLEKECRSLNAMFFTAHTLHRPFVMLKWAQSADGYIDRIRHADQPAAKISSPLSSALMHRWRAAFDGILVGSGTVLADNPRLDTRLWPGKSPRPIILDRRKRVSGDYDILSRDPLIICDDAPLSDVLADLYCKEHITSVMVEGGAKVLQSFINSGIWDLARVETSASELNDGVHAPVIGASTPCKTEYYCGQIVNYYKNNGLIDVKNI